MTISDSNGNVIKKIDTFSDRFGVFKIDNFRIPSDGQPGIWTINAKSGGNFKETQLKVIGQDLGLVISLDKTNYDTSEIVNISGSGARISATVTMKIFDMNGDKVDELNITAKSNGEYLTMWKIPPTFESGEYEITVDDGASNTSIKFNIN